MEEAKDFLEIRIKPDTTYTFHTDVTRHLKQISLYTDNLFSAKNILSENYLSHKDFQYLSVNHYHVPKQNLIKMESRQFQVDREKNILFTKIFYEDLLGKLTYKQYRDFRGIHVCGIVYHICGIVYHICGSFDPQMWYTIPHMWYTQKYFFGILTMIPMPKIQKLF